MSQHGGSKEVRGVPLTEIVVRGIVEPQIESQGSQKTHQIVTKAMQATPPAKAQQKGQK